MASEVKYATQIFTVDGSLASLSTVDLTISGLGWTPKACIIQAVPANPATNPRANAAYSIGATDGTNEWCLNVMNFDNLGTTATRRQAYSNKVLWFRINNANSNSDIADFSVDSFISNGVRLVSNGATSGADVRVQIHFFGGADLQAAAGATGLGTGTSPINVTSPGFEPTAVFAATYGDNLDAGRTSFNILSWGWATNQDATVTQQFTCWSQPNNLGASNNWGHIVTSNLGGQHVNNGTGFNWQVSISDFDSQGFSLTPSANAGSDDFPWLALDTGDRKVSVDVIDSPNSAASDWDITDPGFKPQAAIIAYTSMIAVDTDYQDGTSGTLALAGFDGTRESSVGYFAEDGVATTNTGNEYKDKALFLTDDAGTTIYEGDSPTFENTGFSFASANITTANATTHKFLAFFIEEEAADANTGALVAQAAQISGAGNLEHPGTGALQAGAATISGTANIEHVGTGALQAGAAQISGTAAIIHVGTGGLQAGAAQISGSGSSAGPSAGALVAQSAKIVGSGTYTPLPAPVGGFLKNITSRLLDDVDDIILDGEHDDC